MSRKGVDYPDKLIDTKPGFEQANLVAFVVVDEKENKTGCGYP